MQVAPSLLVVAALATNAGAKLPTCHDAKKPNRAHSIEVSAGRLRYCFLSPAACFAYDGAWVPVAVPKERGAPPPAPTKTTIELSTTAKLCAPDGSSCHSFTTDYLPNRYSIGAAVSASPDGSILALVRSDDLVVLDGKTGAKIATILPWEPTPGPNVTVEFIGDRFVLSRANGNDGFARMYDLATAKLVADLGAVRQHDAIALDGGSFAYLGDRAASIVMRDRAGTIVHTLPFKAKGGVQTFEMMPGKKAILAADGAGVMTLVDLATWATSILPPPPDCP